MPKGYKKSEQMDASMAEFKTSEMKKLKSMMREHKELISKKRESYV